MRYRKNKYGNKKVTIDGIKFDSKGEGARYRDLKLLEEAGKIQDLKLQVRFKMIVNEQLICTYIVDFTYLDLDAVEYIAEDFKGYRTDVYKIKAKLFKALYPEYRFLETS